MVPERFDINQGSGDATQVQLQLSAPDCLVDGPVLLGDLLVATAAGLAAAIPAVIFYNHFLARLRSVDAKVDEFIADMIHRVQGRRG